MSSKLLQGFVLGPWKVDPLRGVVSGPNGETEHLEPKVMDVFVCLAERSDELVTRDELLNSVWSGNTTFDEQLTRVVGELRRALHDDPGDPKYIETVPKRGYRLIGKIRLPDISRLEKNQTRSVSIFQLSEHKLAFATVTVLSLAFVYLAYDEFVVERMQEEAPATTSTQIEDTSVANRWAMSIAVLPFVNLSDDSGNEYFADGLSEEIMNLLTRIPGLKVIGRTSSFYFKGKDEDLRVIGQTLGVKTLLEGSVRKSGEQVRITAKLIDASDGTHIWSETYDRTMTDIFSVQDDVAAAIIDALQIHVGANPTRGRPTESPAAYALFLKAKASNYWFDNVNTHDEELLLEAIEIDPKFAEAYELLAAVYYGMAGGEIPAAEGQKLMGEAAAKALAIDPDLVFARALYQSGDIENWSLVREIAALERAAREQPGNPEILFALSYDLLGAGYLREALGIAERLVFLDPLSPRANLRLFQTLHAVGSTSEAIAAMERRIELGDNEATWDLALINLAAMRDEIAIGYFEAHEQFHPIDALDPTWIRELMTSARDPETGQAYVHDRIANHNYDAQWYLSFGYLDRYFGYILAMDLTDSTWTDAETPIYTGTIYRQYGFTAHPKYLEVAEAIGITDVWEQRGPPDFCEKLNGQWVCE